MEMRASFIRGEWREQFDVKELKQLFQYEKHPNEFYKKALARV
jgi:hypothetical protein